MHLYYTEVVFIYVYTVHTHTHTLAFLLQDSAILQIFFKTLCAFQVISARFTSSSVRDRSRICYNHPIISFIFVVASNLTNQVAAPGTPTF